MISTHIASALAELQALADPAYLETVERAAGLLRQSLEAGGKILIFGNGGSAADAQHIAAELVGRYRVERGAIAAIALTTDSSIFTAWSNDYDYDTVFSRQIEALGRPADAAWGISTSGNSRNVVLGLEMAKSMGLRTVAMVGKDGGEAARIADTAIIAPGSQTAHIQEAHLISYHAICGALDEDALANRRFGQGTP